MVFYLFSYLNFGDQGFLSFFFILLIIYMQYFFVFLPLIKEVFMYYVISRRTHRTTSGQRVKRMLKMCTKPMPGALEFNLKVGHL